jgi:hypothetical protein
VIELPVIRLLDRLFPPRLFGAHGCDYLKRLHYLSGRIPTKAPPLPQDRIASPAAGSSHSTPLSRPDVNAPSPRAK